jgi:glycosyltransferase involved in cell wall biosynthesis
VDDQSKDQSVTIAQQYAAKDTRIQVYINEKNLGDYPNRNRAASYAKGTYLKYLDADDLIYPHGLGVMVETMEQFPECALGISQEVAEDFKPYPFVMKPHETFHREFLQRGVLGMGPTATIIRREVFEALGGFTGTRYIGDTEMWYKLAVKHPVVKMVPGLIFWRRHDDQEITKGQDSFFYLENAYKHAVETLMYKNFPLSKQEKQMALQITQKRFSRNILRLLKLGKFKEAYRITRSVNVKWWQLFKAFC